MTLTPVDLSRFPRIGAFTPPTPFAEMPRLREAVGARPRLFVKRDDATLVALGGNKVRKLDFVMADAREAGADTIVTWGSVQSNSCRQTAAFARQLGMECRLVLAGPKPPIRQGNLLVMTILGAGLHFIGEDADPEACALDLTEELRAAGRRPYCVHVGASVPLGALGYVESLAEIARQSKAAGVEIGHLFTASGSAGTQAGAIVGAALSSPVLRIHGVAISRAASLQREKVAVLANGTFALLGLPDRTTPDAVIVHDEYYGGEYGVATPAGIEAIRLAARTEGLLLDPVYTGKAMAGMLDQLQRGNLDDAEAVVFIHTGGTPALFSHAERFQV